MSNTIKCLRKCLDKLYYEREKKQDIFDSRTESWQESEKGKQYQYMIDAIDEAADDVYRHIEELEELYAN
jgi:hypothetical protein